DQDAGALVAEVRRARRIGADVVAANRVAVRTEGGGILAEIDAGDAVAADGVAGTGDRPADGVPPGGVDKGDAGLEVAEDARQVGLEADQVSLDDVAGGVRTLEGDAGEGVAGDDIAGTRGGTADDVTVRPTDEDARVAVGDRRRAGRIGTDV